MNNVPGNVLLIAGTHAEVPVVLEMLASAGVLTTTNPDLYIREYRQFGIDDAQELRTRASTKAVGDRRVFIITASGMTSEAQNALLKTLEEPPDDALFVFVIPSPESLLMTVRSRSHIVAIKREHSEAARIDSKAFFAASPVKRIELLKAVLQKDDDDKYDTGAILAFLAELEREASRARDPIAKKSALDAVYRARGYMGDRGALVKTLLESVALLSPRI